MKKRIVAIMLVTFMLMVGCAVQNKYSVNLTIESQVASVMEQYTVWYELAPPEIQEQWKAAFTPAFEKMDLLMDTYHNMVKNDLTTASILLEINRLKTQIMMELVKRQSEVPDGE